MKEKESKVWTVVSIAVIVVLSLMLALNLTVIIQGIANPDDPPSVFGITPLVVLSGSMEGDKDGCFEAGSLVYVKDVNTDDLNVGDVIAFKDPASKSKPKSITTHRIIDTFTLEDGRRAFITGGDATGAKDSYYVTDDDVIGIYSFHIKGLGKFMMFLESPVGMLVFVGVPLTAVILVDVFVVRRKALKKKDEETAAMEEELQRLRKLAESVEASAPVAESKESGEEATPNDSEENKEA